MLTDSVSGVKKTVVPGNSKPLTHQEWQDNLSTRTHLKHHKDRRELPEQKEDVTPFFTVCATISFKSKDV